MLKSNSDKSKNNSLGLATSWSVIRRSIQVLTKKEQQKISLVIILQIFLGLLDLAGVIIVGLLGSLAISGVSSGQDGDRVGFVIRTLNLDNKPLQAQAAYLGILAALLLTSKTLFSLFFTRRILYFLSRRGASLSSTLISKLLGQSLLKIQERSMQQTIYTVTTGVTTVTVGILGSLVYLISDISLLVILITGLFIVDTLIAFSTLIIFSVIGYLLYQIMHVKVRELGNSQALLSIESSEKIAEVLGSYRELVVKNRRHFYSREIGELRLGLANVTAENTFLQNISKYVLELAIVLGALVISAVQFSTQTATHAVAVLGIFLVASTRIGPAVLRIQQGALQIKSSIGASEPTLQLIEELGKESPIEKVSDDLDTGYRGFKAQVSLQDVTFSYPGQTRPAISKVSMEIGEGSIVAIVGSSGAGKTTLVDLLLGVLNPSQGKINISGVEPSVATRSWSGAISYVPQDVVIINGTIRNNVAMGYPANMATDTLVSEALRIAQLQSFVSQLPIGFDTYLGDRGTRISGGQRQRLGIARAMFTKPSLLILDEATSALDGETEANLSDAIQEMRGSVTVIMIAHRLSTVRNADTVIYLDNGKIKGMGTFEEVRDSVPDFDRQAKLMGL